MRIKTAGRRAGRGNRRDSNNKSDFLGRLVNQIFSYVGCFAIDDA
jgi:hypothetical protein